MKDKKPAKHSKNSFDDQQATSIVSLMISKTGKAMPDLKSNDKWPNIDGYIELVDESGYPKGSLKVQIKKLSENSIKKLNYSFSNDKFLSYCKESFDYIPIIFIGVDIKNQKAYWLHIDKHFVDELKGSKIIKLDSKKIIDSSSDNFINDWQNLVEVYKSKSEEFEKYKKAFSILGDVINPALGLSKDFFKNIHIFLDSINSYFDNEFAIVKSCFYPNQWKIGLAYYEYNPNRIIYTLYPIPYNKNDVQIKEVGNDIKKQIEMQSLGFVGHLSNNPIETRPKEYAKEKIKERTGKIIENKLLSHTGNDFLSREFIFAFIDEFYEQMGLEQGKDVYNIEEIKNGFDNYLPLWLEEAHNFLFENNRNNYVERVQIGRIEFLDPDFISSIIGNERNMIKKNIIKRIENGQNKTKNYPIGNEKFPFGIFIEFLESIKTTNIKRLYKPKDYSNLEKKNSGWVWDIFTKEDTEYNFKLIVENILEVYSNFINANFPLLKEELSLFQNNSDKILFSIELEDEYKNHTGPGYKIFYGKSNTPTSTLEKSIDFIDYDEIKDFDFFTTNKIIKYKGIDYEIITYLSSVLDFLYEKTPMLNLIYKILKDRMKDLFENKIK